MIATDMGQAADNQTGGMGGGTGQMLEREGERCHSFPLELHGVHVPTHGVRRDILSNL